MKNNLCFKLQGTRRQNELINIGLKDFRLVYVGRGIFKIKIQKIHRMYFEETGRFKDSFDEYNFSKPQTLF